MRRKELALTALLAVVLLATVLVLPQLTQARPAYEIPVHDAGDGDRFAGADGDGWDRAPAATVPLGSTGADVPKADEVSIESVEVQAARTDERLYVRLTWDDGTRDESTAAIRSFADAAAIQFPSDRESRPPLAMGGMDNQVNLWYWAADGAEEELLAGGPGTITAFDEAAVTTDEAYADDRWHVVFSRPIDAAGTNRTAITTDDDLDVAVAVWNGSDAERSGRKAASEWYYLATGPGPEGPPYETLLWAVAGIAIVLTTLVTVAGVRRTRGE